MVIVEHYSKSENNEPFYYLADREHGCYESDDFIETTHEDTTQNRIQFNIKEILC